MIADNQPDSDLQTALAVARSAAKEAEKIILKYYGDAIRAELKSDQSPVTIADREAESVIRRVIQSTFPKHGFMGEETGHFLTSSDFLWIVDPIDGTKNYLRKIPLFATQIALVASGKAIVGVSNAPSMYEMYSAAKGIGVHDQEGKSLRVSSVRRIEEAHVSLGGLNHFAKIGRLRGVEDLVVSAARSRAIGDAYAYHLLASGRLEAVIEAKIRIWDVAALSLIIEEAGGSVTDIDGKPLNKDSTTIIASNGLIHEKIVALFDRTKH